MKYIKILTLLLLIFLAGCEKAPSEVPPIPSPDLSDSLSISEGEKNTISADIIGVWEIQIYAKNAIDGTDYDLQSYYGSGLKYGGRLTLNEDGTFSKYIGITGDGDYEGTYSLEGNEITFNFYNDSVGKATYLPSSQEIEYYNEYDPPFYEYFLKVN